MSKRLDSLERVEVANTTALRDWLSRHHRRSGSCWLVTGKKCAGERYIPYNAIVEELLCFGWIDSVPRALDDLRTMTLISPRKPGSNWSKDNRERVARLEREGRMHPAGLECVALARRDGSWGRLKQTETGQAPPDLAAALKTGGATVQWDALTLSVRRRSLELLLAAKRPETRKKRIAQIVAASAVGKDPSLWKPKRR